MNSCYPLLSRPIMYSASSSSMLASYHNFPYRPLETLSSGSHVFSEQRSNKYTTTELTNLLTYFFTVLGESTPPQHRRFHLPVVLAQGTNKKAIVQQNYQHEHTIKPLLNVELLQQLPHCTALQLVPTYTCN